MERVVDFKDLKTIVCSFDLKEVEQSLSKYNAQDLNSALEEESISPYKHATLDKAKLLVKHGIDVNLSLGNGLKAIGFVNDWHVFKLMVDNGLDFEHGIFIGVNVFATQFNSKILQYIHDKTGIKPDFDNSSDIKTHYSYQYIPYEYDLLKMYLENDFINKGFAFHKNETLPFYVNDVDSLKLMDKYGFDFFHKNDEGETCLTKCQSVEAFKFLHEEKGIPYKDENKNMVDSYLCRPEIKKYLIKEKDEKFSFKDMLSADMLDFLIHEYYTPEQNKEIAEDLYYNLTVEATERDKIAKSLRASIIHVLEGFNLDADDMKNIDGAMEGFRDISWIRHYLTFDQFETFMNLFDDKLGAISDYNFHGIDLIADGSSTSNTLFNIAKKYYDNGYLDEDQLEHVKHYQSVKTTKTKKDLPLTKASADEMINIEKVITYFDKNPTMKSLLLQSTENSLAFWGYFSPDHQETVQNTQWIIDSYDPIGLQIKDGYQSYISFNSDNEFYTLCNYVQDIPLALFYIDRGVRLSCRPINLDDGSEDDFLMAFDEYKHWCQENGLVLDQDGVFLDDNKEFLRTRLYIN